MSDQANSRGTDALELELRHIDGVYSVTFDESDAVMLVEIATYRGIDRSAVAAEALALSQAYLEVEVRVNVTSAS